MTTITARPFSSNGEVMLYTLKNQHGMEVSISSLGAAIVSVLVPDRDGAMADVVLGYDTPEEYRAGSAYLGATVGRCANRISGGCFSLNGREHQLTRNEDGKTHLHGGACGFSHRIWKGKIVESDHGQALVMLLVSPDGDEGYPGTLKATVVFSLTSLGELILSYWALSDQDTLCSLTNHSYFNLGGHNSGDILGHELQIFAKKAVEAGADHLPSGQLVPVAGTPLDFSKARRVGERIREGSFMLPQYGGYDHCYALDGGVCEEPRACALLTHPESGRYLFCRTTAPGVQLYTANALQASGKGGALYGAYSGLCLETQFFPDAVHHPQWPSPVLKAGAPWDSVTIYQFGVKGR